MPRAEPPITASAPWRIGNPCRSRCCRDQQPPGQFVGRDRRAVVIHAAAWAQGMAEGCQTVKGRTYFTALAQGLLAAVELMLPEVRHGRPAHHA